MINGVKTSTKKIYKRNYKIKLENGEIYDQFWKMFFYNEDDYAYFLNEIQKAEDDIKYGRVCTEEEVWGYFRKKYGANV